MTTTRSVALVSDESGWGRALVASLPRSLRQTDASHAEIALIDGRGDWADLALAHLGHGCHQVLVIEPAYADADADADTIARLADAVDASGASCILSERLAGNPAIPGFRDWLGAEFGTITLEGVDAAAPAMIVFAQLRLLRALHLIVAQFDRVAQTITGCLIEAVALSGARQIHVRLAAAQSSAGPPGHLVSAYAPTACARLEVRLGGPARPASASLFTAQGMQVLPSVHESAHRHHLRALIEGRDRASADELRAFARDVALASSLQAGR